MTNNASLVKGMKPNAFRGLLIGIFKFFYDELQSATLCTMVSTFILLYVDGKREWIFKE